MSSFSRIERGKRGLFARAMGVKAAVRGASGLATRHAAGERATRPSVLKRIAADSRARAAAFR